MTANSHWLRWVADKYGIRGIDRQVVEGCAEKLERLEELQREVERLITEAKRFIEERVT